MLNGRIHMNSKIDGLDCEGSCQPSQSRIQTLSPALLNAIAWRDLGCREITFHLACVDSIDMAKAWAMPGAEPGTSCAQAAQHSPSKQIGRQRLLVEAPLLVHLCADRHGKLPSGEGALGDAVIRPRIRLGDAAED